jgi:hypothetical protein
MVIATKDLQFKATTQFNVSLKHFIKHSKLKSFTLLQTNNNYVLTKPFFTRMYKRKKFAGFELLYQPVRVVHDEDDEAIHDETDDEAIVITGVKGKQLPTNKLGITRSSQNRIISTNHLIRMMAKCKCILSSLIRCSQNFTTPDDTEDAISWVSNMFESIETVSFGTFKEALHKHHPFFKHLRPEGIDFICSHDSPTVITLQDLFWTIFDTCSKARSLFERDLKHAQDELLINELLDVDEDDNQSMVEDISECKMDLSDTEIISMFNVDDNYETKYDDDFVTSEEEEEDIDEEEVVTSSDDDACDSVTDVEDLVVDDLIRDLLNTIITELENEQDLITKPIVVYDSDCEIIQQDEVPKKRGRGRPRKYAKQENDVIKPKRGRGRPRKSIEQENEVLLQKRGRGRPRKSIEQNEVLLPKKRGRPRKIIHEDSDTSDDFITPKKRIVQQDSEDSDIQQDEVPKRGRGRPRKIIHEDSDTSDDFITPTKRILSVVQQDNTLDDFTSILSPKQGYAHVTSIVEQPLNNVFDIISSPKKRGRPPGRAKYHRRTRDSDFILDVPLNVIPSTNERPPRERRPIDRGFFVTDGFDFTI